MQGRRFGRKEREKQSRGRRKSPGPVYRFGTAVVGRDSILEHMGWSRKVAGEPGVV